MKISKSVIIGLSFLGLVALGYFGRILLNEAFSPVLSIEGELYDFGVVDKGTAINFYLNLKNVGKSDLELLNVSTDCGCTVVDWQSLERIEPNGIDSLLITYSTESSGGFNRKVIIETNTIDSPYIFYISGVVKEN